MTLCIAAACDEDGEGRIVVCTDWKAENPLGVTQTADKFHKIGKPSGWIALAAGTASRAVEMINFVRGSFAEAEEVKYSNVVNLIRRALGVHAVNLREEYCLLRFGMSYTEYKDWCKTLPIEVLRDSIAKIENIKFGASLLVAGFTYDTDQSPLPVICRVSQQTNEVIMESGFGAIGDGRTVAVPSLYRREYDSEVPVAKAIYQVYEAKTLAEIIGSVGTDTSIDIVYPSGELKSLSDDGYEYYGNLLKEFGPKPRVTGIKLLKKYLRPFEDKKDDKKSSDRIPP